MPKLKTGPKVVFIVLIAFAVIFGLKFAGERGWIPTPGIMKALVPNKVGGNIPSVEDAKIQNVKPIAFPSNSPAHVAATLVRAEVWEWNAQNGLIYANGGAETTTGSLMAKHGVNLLLSRQDDTSKMGEDLITCAKEIKNGSQQCSSGANFVVIMGDGAGNFISGINPQLKKLGPDYGLKVFGAFGYSRGEDAWMAPPEVKHDPNAARGLLSEQVLRDGDWDIMVRWAGDNNIPVNPDEGTYDASAINVLNASDYNVAAADYISGKCEDRRVVKDGHPTGETKHVCVNAVATWTPGDVSIAQKKGGLVKIASSKEYRSQMPAVAIGPAKFLRDNRDEIQNLLAASFEAADQINAYPTALQKTSEIAAKLYNDQDAKYWAKYFHPVVEQDAQGLRVSLGGSYVANLADNQILFGLQPGTNDNFRSTYNTFAAIDVQQYPSIFKNTPIPDVKDVEDKTFVEGAANVATSGAAAESVDYSAGESGTVIGSRDYSINFDTGKSSFTPDGLRTMAQLKDLLATSALFISVTGYTDNTGNEQANIALSQARAEAVKNYLQRVAPKNFPDSRFSVEGKGSADAIGDNSTAAGKAANRRVHIVLSGS